MRPSSFQPEHVHRSSSTLLSDVQLPDRPYLDASFARRGDFRRDLDRVIQVACFDEVEARELLHGFGEWAVGDGNLPVPHSHRRRGFGRLERLCGVQRAPVAQPVSVVGTLPIRYFGQLPFFHVDEAEVLHMSINRSGEVLFDTGLKWTVRRAASPENGAPAPAGRA